jgi:hypothetical protein
MQGHRHVTLVVVPVALVFSDPDVAVGLVLVEQDLLKDKCQVIQVCNRLLVLELSFSISLLQSSVLGFIKFEQDTLATENDSDNRRIGGRAVQLGVEVHLQVNVFAN